MVHLLNERTACLFLGVSLTLLSAMPLFGQQERSQQPNDGLTAKFQLADAYLRAGQFDRAVSLLEDLYRLNPDSYVFFDKLKSAYVSLKRYDEAIRLVDERSENGATPDLLAEKASLLYQQGEEETAYATWDEAVDLSPTDPQTYRVVYFSLSNNRLFEPAIDVLERGRVALKDSNAFRTDLSYLYGLMSAHAQAMREYIQLLNDNPRQLPFVKRRLAQFSEQETMVRASLSVLERSVRRDPLNRELRELAAWLYMEGAQYEEAFDAYKAIDRLEAEDGRVLFAFAQNATDAGAFSVAQNAYEEILDRHPQAPSASSAMFGLAEMHERQGYLAGERAFDPRGNRVEAPHFGKALETYRSFLQAYPQDPRFPQALQRIGQLQQRVFYDLGAAEATLGEVTRRYAQTEAAARARFELGLIALQRGDLIQARLVFARLEDELEIGELAERAQFEMARVDYYTGQLESALTLVSALDANTSTDIANDAIALKVLLRENKGPDSLSTPLRLYARAELLARQRRPQAALTLLDSLLSIYPAHPLEDEVRFARATAFRDMGQYEQALEAYGEIPDLFKNSYLTDRSLFATAEIYERELHDPAGAMDAYQRLLVTYPGSLLAPEVRARIRELRGDGI